MYNNEDRKKQKKKLKKKKKKKNDKKRSDKAKRNGDRCPAAINPIIELQLTGYRSTIIPARGRGGGGLLQVRASRGSSSRLAVIGRADGRGSLGFQPVESEERVALTDAIKAGYIVRREKNEGQYAYTHVYTLCFRISSFLR